MEFMKCRVHTVLYSEQVKAGMKGYMANSLYNLKSYVKEENPSALHTLKKVYSDRWGDNCFQDSNNQVWRYFYPIEEESR